MKLLLLPIVAVLSCPASDDGFERDIDFKGNDDLKHVANVSSAQQCCAICASTIGCNALSFGPLPDFGCMLKKSSKGRRSMAGRLSYVLRQVPTPPPTPAPPQVTEIHVVASNHFDGGCKIGGCQPDGSAPDGWTDPIWPVQCATTMHGRGQPHAYHVLNRYFSNFFPAAATLGDAARATNGSYAWMTQPWIVDLYLNCNRANYRADPRYGGAPLLQCPNASAVARFKRAVALGDIFWHAAATDQEAGYFPNAGLFEASLVLNERLATELGVSASTVVSTRDVPGWTRAAIPLLAKHGINGMSFGSSPQPGRPEGVPPLFVWRDEDSGHEVVVTSETGYGGPRELFVLPNGVALAADWTGDNSGPHDVASQLDSLRRAHPGAKVHCSSFSAFFDEANKPENKKQLPVVTSEIGDAWIYGVPSDPLKNAQFREVSRARDECVGSGLCDPNSAAMRDFDRLLVKVPEHTWGLAQSWFTADYQNYTNAQFHKALAAGMALGPLSDQADRRGGASKWYADYFTTVQSWYEQRSFISNAVGAIANAEAVQETGFPKGWATELAARIASLSDVRIPSTTGFHRVASDSAAGTSVLQCGSSVQLAFDGTGAIVHLAHVLSTAGADGGISSWANSSRPLGQFVYQTFDTNDYASFLAPAPSGFGMPQCNDSNTGWALCGNFNRPNMSAANPKHRSVSPALMSVWQRNSTNGDGCSFVLESDMDADLHEVAGAPSKVYTLFTIGVEAAHQSTTAITTVDMEVRMMNKTATRLPESIMVVFRPAFELDQAEHGWRLEMFNDSSIALDPTDVAQGGAPHTRCVSGIRRTGLRHGCDINGTFALASADVPCVSVGEPSPFPTPRDGVPDMRLGVAYNVLNNIWNTNYVLWYPFDDKDKDLKARFAMTFEDSVSRRSVAPADDFDTAIADTHIAAAHNRELLLNNTWAFDTSPPPLPDGCAVDDVCHANKCRHCNCQSGKPPCPTPALGPGSYPNCPNQVQCGAMPAAQVALFRNDNATKVAMANAWLEANFANTSSDWWRMTLNGSGWCGAPLENSYSIVTFAMFNSRSRWVLSEQVAPLSPGAEEGMQKFWFTYVQRCAQLYPGEATGNPLRLHDSENIDTVRHTGCYFGAATLSLFPDYANRTLPDKTTVYETSLLWEAFTYSWLKAKALNGFFDELGSSGYWTRTWPCVWALHTLSAPNSRVHLRAKMFIDLAMLEAELSSINGVRAGQKSRDKKATCVTCSKSGGNNPALEHHMYTALTPQLYGDDINGPVGRLYQAHIATQQTGSYKMGNVSVLIHKFGASPETGGVFTMHNRMMGQVSGAGAQSCTKERCDETFRPYPCACEGGGSWHTLLPHSKQIHVVSRTPAYALAGVQFSPNDAFVANSQQRGTGLTFSNTYHSAVALPHLTGEKWGIVDQDVMLVQRCGSCNYGGPALFQIYNASAVWQEGTSGWWFLTAADDTTGKATGWAAMRPAWGSTNFTNTTSPTSRLLAGAINLQDTWSPLVLVAADAAVYGTLANFTSQVLAAPLVADANHSRIEFSWHGRSFAFTPGPNTWKGHWTLPTLDGKAIDIDPPYVYRSPHLNAALDSPIVTASYGNYTLIYNFTDDTIKRGSTQQL